MGPPGANRDGQRLKTHLGLCSVRSAFAVSLTGRQRSFSNSTFFLLDGSFGHENLTKDHPYWWMICIFNWLYLLSLFKCGQLWMGRTRVLVMSPNDTFSKAMLSASLNTFRARLWRLNSSDWSHPWAVRPPLTSHGWQVWARPCSNVCVVCQLKSWWVGCEPDILRCEDVGYIWESQGGNWSLPRLLVQDEKYIAFSNANISVPLLTGYILKPSNEEDFWWISFS